MRFITLCTFTLVALSLRAQNQGPDAPVITVHYEGGMGFNFHISNPAGSNNYQQGYVEAILPADSSADPYWRFQGYVLFQFVDEAAASGGDLPQAVLDQSLAKPVLGIDKNDNVSAMSDTYDPLGADDCAEQYWVLSNSGLWSDVSAVFDPFTNEPYVLGQTYCFVMMAYAYSQDHVDAGCNSVDHVIWSSQAPGGAITATCAVADPFAGVAEHRSASSFTLMADGTNAWRCTFSDGAMHTLRITDASGRAQETRTLRAGDRIELDGLAEGVYIVQALAEADAKGARVIVQH